jgi:NitT/TauT family transport system ATP-binding protein
MVKSADYRASVDSEGIWNRISAEDVAVTVRGVSHRYGATEPRVLENISLDVRYGEIVCLVGRSGCGKTTLLNILAGLVPPAEGTALVCGQPPVESRRLMGYMFARDALLPWRTAKANVSLSLEAAGLARRARAERAQYWLDRVGLGDEGARYPGQLSQGMRQRVAIARTLATNPKVLLLDEPFAALDVQTRVGMQNILLGLLEPHAPATVFVTHDLGEALSVGDRVLVMADGFIAKEIAVPFPHPRNVGKIRLSEEFTTMHRELWSEIGFGF